MRILIIVFCFSLIDTFEGLAQCDTIYEVLGEINLEKIDLFIIKDKEKIYIKQMTTVPIIKYYSSINKKGYFLKFHKKRKIYLIEANKGYKFSGILEIYKNNETILTSVKNGVPTKRFIYDENEKLRIKYKIKYRKNHNYIDKIELKKSYIQYYSTGIIKIKSNIYKDAFFGRYIEYYPNGKIKIRGHYNLIGKKTGKWIFYDKMGKKHSEINYS